MRGHRKKGVGYQIDQYADVYHLVISHKKNQIQSKFQEPPTPLRPMLHERCHLREAAPQAWEPDAFNKILNREKSTF